MSLRIVTPPDARIVALEDMRAHLRITGHTDDDGWIADAMLAAEASIDGYTGRLGRAVMSQTWRQVFDGWGDLRLAMPDVTAVTVTCDDGEGGETPADTAELRFDRRGWFVRATGPATEQVYVNMTCAMPASLRPQVAVIVKQLVAHWWDVRGAAQAGSVAIVPLSADDMIEALRWRSA